MDALKLLEILRLCWDGDSAFGKEDWSVENPARGQCAVSSLVIQDYLGGEIVRFAVEFSGVKEKHFANVVAGVVIDATFSQFPEEVELEMSAPDLGGFGSIRQKLLADSDTKR